MRRTAEQIRQHRENKSGLYDSPINNDKVTFYRPQDGEGQFRVLPATWDGAGHYGLEVWTHPFVGANASTYLCSEKMNTGKPCACCDEMRRMKKAGATKEELRDISPRQRYWYFVTDRDKPGDVPQIYDASWSQDRTITDQTVSERTGETLYIDDPDDGYDVIVKKSGKGKENTKYVFSIDRHSSPLMKRAADADALRVFSEDNPITSLLKFYDYEHIDKNLNGTAPTRDRDDLDRGGRDRDDGRDRDRDRSRDDDDRGRGRDADRDRPRDRDDDDRGRDRDRTDRDRDDERPRGRGRMADDDDRVSDRDRDSSRGDDDRDADRPRGRDRDDDRDGDRDRGRDDDRPRATRGNRDDRDDRDDDRGRDRDDDRGDRGRDDRDRDDGRRERSRR